jgi:CHASE3 domain sensor protein
MTTQPESPPDETEALREEVAQTREDLAETAQALTDKLNVKKQAKESASKVRERARVLPSQAVGTVRREAPRAASKANEVARNYRSAVIGGSVLIVAVLVWAIARRRR